MKIGQLRNRIEFQRLEDMSEKFDKEGFPIENYKTFQRAWADVNDLYGKEHFQSKQLISENITIFHTRYYKNIDVNCIIEFRGQRYEIFEIDNVKYLNKELKIKAKLQVINNGA